MKTSTYTHQLTIGTGKDYFLVSVDFKVMPEEPADFYSPYEPTDIDISSFEILKWNGKKVDSIKKRETSLFYSLLLRSAEELLEESVARKELINAYKEQSEDNYIDYLAGELL